MISGLFTDYYELTMANACFLHGFNRPAVFDMFFRKHPFGGGFSVFCGSQSLFSQLADFRFSDGDIDFLRSKGIFDEKFLRYLRGFRFSGDIWAADEGSIVFPNEPLLRVHAPLIEAILLEGFVLNTVNFQSLIATKTARVYLASRCGSIMEFGLRRAHGFDGAMSATRASYVGGASSTSNAMAAMRYRIPAAGTIAHSWVMSFENEEAAFDAYAKIYPKGSVFLLDTYDTLGSGIESAIRSGKKLMERGLNFGVRLDSGDIQYLSQEVRKKLDEAGCNDAKIVISNDLNEEIIDSLVSRNAPIDSWGVGTQLVTGGSDSSFTGVYKLCRREDADGREVNMMKISDNPAKMTNPGVKNVFRLYAADGKAKADVVAKEGEAVEAGVERTFFHPSLDYRQFSFSPAKVEPLLKKQVAAGETLDKSDEKAAVERSRAKFLSQLEVFDKSHTRLLNPHIYKVSLTEALRDEKAAFIAARKR